jgi:hypothetical protein
VAHHHQHPRRAGHRPLGRPSPERRPAAPIHLAAHVAGAYGHTPLPPRYQHPRHARDGALGRPSPERRPAAPIRTGEHVAGAYGHTPLPPRYQHPRRARDGALHLPASAAPRAIRPPPHIGTATGQGADRARATMLCGSPPPTSEAGRSSPAGTSVARTPPRGAAPPRRARRRGVWPYAPTTPIPTSEARQGWRAAPPR